MPLDHAGHARLVFHGLSAVAALKQVIFRRGFVELITFSTA